MATTRVEVSAEAFGVLIQGLNNYKIKSDDQWFTAAEIREIMGKHTSEPDEQGRQRVLIERGSKAAIEFEGAQWRLLTEAFNHARAHDVYQSGQAPFVVEAMKAVKEAKELPAAK